MCFDFVTVEPVQLKTDPQDCRPGSLATLIAADDTSAEVSSLSAMFVITSSVMPDALIALRVTHDSMTAVMLTAPFILCVMDDTMTALMNDSVTAYAHTLMISVLMPLVLFVISLVFSALVSRTPNPLRHPPKLLNVPCSWCARHGQEPYPKFLNMPSSTARGKVF